MTMTPTRLRWRISDLVMILEGSWASTISISTARLHKIGRPANDNHLGGHAA